MTVERLSALDASFLSVETSTAHMHVGWVAVFSPSEDGQLPSFAELREHISRRLAHAPRYRQKLASVPLGLHSPEWADDEGFSIDRHLYRASGPLEGLVDEVMSIPLRRDRPLWEMWICEDAGDGRLAIVGKTHHCMVDGLAAVELASMLLDTTPEPAESEPDSWSAAPPPGAERLLARGVRDLLGQQLDLLHWSLRVAASPAPVVRQTASGAMRATRALTHLLRAAPASMLNERQSPLRRLAWAQRPLADLKTIKRAYGTTVNDVVLAVVAGGMRSYLLRRGEQPAALKVMVPVSVRSDADVLGNRISFVFADLPCNEPDPIGRLYQVHASMSRRKRDGVPEGSDLVLKAAARTPTSVQQMFSRVMSGARAFNLVVSNIPGPSVPMYMLGCRLAAVYPVVPLADNHAVSVGMVTVHDQACFGVYADRETMPDAGMLAQDIDDAIGELLAGTEQAMESAGSLLLRARAAAVSTDPDPEAATPRRSPRRYEPRSDDAGETAPTPAERAPRFVRPSAAERAEAAERAATAERAGTAERAAKAERAGITERAATAELTPPFEAARATESTTGDGRAPTFDRAELADSGGALADDAGGYVRRVSRAERQDTEAAATDTGAGDGQELRSRPREEHRAPPRWSREDPEI
jgi:diacylglycerol O-acyltransferase / wax synthase